MGKEFKIKPEFSLEHLEEIKKAFETYKHQSCLYDNYRKNEFNDWESWFFSYFTARINMKEKGLETCPKCNFSVMKTMGSIPCAECGLVGQCPWGG